MAKAKLKFEIKLINILCSLFSLVFVREIVVQAQDTTGHQTCSSPDAMLRQLTQNITSLKKDLQGEMEDRLERLSDMMMKALQDQIQCHQQMENQVNSKKECSKDSSSQDFTHKIPVCDSTNCMDLSSRMLDLLDHSSDPCEDFYQYACGGVEADPNLAAEDPQRDADERIREKLESLDLPNPIMGQARIFYDSCQQRQSTSLSPTSLQYAKNVVRHIGWFHPSAMATKSFDEDFSHLPPITNLTFILATFMKSHFAPFFDVTLEVDPSNNEHFVPRITLPLTKPKLSAEIDHLTCIEKFQKKVAHARRESVSLDLNSEYENYMTCKNSGDGLGNKLNLMVEAVSAMNLMDFIKSHTVRDELMGDSKINTETLLYDITKIRPSAAQQKLSMINKEFQVNKLNDLNSLFSNVIEWHEFFRILTGKTFDPEQKIHVYHQKELSEIITIIGNEWRLNSKAVQNILLMLWSERVYNDLVSPLEVEPDYCLQTTKYLFPDLSSALYLHSFPDAQLTKLQRKVTSKVNSIKEKMENILKDNHHYSQQVIKKVSGISINVGAAQNSDSRNSTLVNNVKGLNLNASHSYNVDILLKRFRRLLYELLDEKTGTPKALWLQGIVPFEANGFTVHETNKVYIPSGLFISPYYYYRKNIPEYINFGGLGHVIAGQLIHLLDSTGIKFNGFNKSSLEIPKSLISATECLNEPLQYNFQLQDKGVSASFKLLRNLHLNDLLAASGATRLAWQAYLQTVHTEGSGPPSNESPEEHLIWLGTTPLHPLQAYFLRIAQTQCQSSSEFDLIKIMESDILHPRYRINLMTRNEPLFAEAFQCSRGSLMNSPEPCPFSLH